MGALHRLIHGKGGPWVYLLCPIPLFISLMAFAWPHLQAVRLGYDFQRLQLERSQLLQLNAELKVGRAALRSPARIEVLARRDLGMVDARPEQLIWVRLSPKGVLSPPGDTRRGVDP